MMMMVMMMMMMISLGGHSMRDQKKESELVFGPLKSHLTANISKTISQRLGALHVN